MKWNEQPTTFGTETTRTISVNFPHSSEPREQVSMKWNKRPADTVLYEDHQNGASEVVVHRGRRDCTKWQLEVYREVIPSQTTFSLVLLLYASQTPLDSDRFNPVFGLFSAALST